MYTYCPGKLKCFLLFQTVSKLSKAPERMFKVVLAGDAAVGKSSLIMRLCKGKFVSNLSSTLGEYNVVVFFLKTKFNRTPHSIQLMEKMSIEYLCRIYIL